MSLDFSKNDFSYMIKIYHSNINPFIRSVNFFKYLSSMPTLIQEKISKLKSVEEKYTSLAGYVLLKKGLKANGFSDDLENLKYTMYGKPHIQNAIDFNISHSNGHVVCAFSTIGRIGIDLELIRPVKILNFKKIFCENEWKFIISSTKPAKAFFYLWTAKEAILKADGRGLNAPLNKISIDVHNCKLEETTWYCYSIPVFQRYITHVALESKANKFIIEEINLTNNYHKKFRVYNFDQIKI